MFQAWRMQLKEARVAWQNGRYDDAGAILTMDSLRDFLPAKQLAREVAGKIVERAGARLLGGDSSAGWRDLQQADRLGGQMEAISKMRSQYAERVLREAHGDLIAGQFAAAISLVDKLQKRGLCDERGRVLRLV